MPLEGTTGTRAFLFCRNFRKGSKILLGSLYLQRANVALGKVTLEGPLHSAVLAGIAHIQECLWYKMVLLELPDEVGEQP